MPMAATYAVTRAVLVQYEHLARRKPALNVKKQQQQKRHIWVLLRGVYQKDFAVLGQLCAKGITR